MRISVSNPKSRRMVKLARRVFVRVAGTEFDIQVTKKELNALAAHVGGWNELTVLVHENADNTVDAYYFRRD